MILNSELKSIREKTEKLARIKIELEQKILEQMQDQITMDKAGRNMAKLVTDLRKDVISEVPSSVIHVFSTLEQETTLSEVENDIAKNLVLVEELESVLEQTEETLKQIETETTEKDEVVAKFQTESKRSAGINYCSDPPANDLGI